MLACLGLGFVLGRVTPSWQASAPANESLAPAVTAWPVLSVIAGDTGFLMYGSIEALATSTALIAQSRGANQ